MTACLVILLFFALFAGVVIYTTRCAFRDMEETERIKCAGCKTAYDSDFLCCPRCLRDNPLHSSSPR